MRAKLSVVIPTLNAAEALPDCLAALMEGVEAGMIRELVIADGGSTDATLKIAEAAGALLVEGAASRGGQLRQGAGIAEGDWLFFQHADTRLQPGWTEVLAAQMASGEPAYFRLQFDRPGITPFLVAGWANLRSRLFSLPYGDQGLLISRQEYEAFGGFRDIPLMEDVAMARLLKRRLKMLPMCVTTSAVRYQREGWMRRGMRNLILLLRFFAGADPEALARRY